MRSFSQRPTPPTASVLPIAPTRQPGCVSRTSRPLARRVQSNAPDARAAKRAKTQTLMPLQLRCNISWWNGLPARTDAQCPAQSMDPLSVISTSESGRSVRQFRTAAAPIVIAGFQLRLLYLSAFAQATTMPSTAQFFLFTGNNWRSTLEAGVRYNIGSSIDPMR